MSLTIQHDSFEIKFDNAMRKEWSSNLAILVERPRTFALSLWEGISLGLYEIGKYNKQPLFYRGREVDQCRLSEYTRWCDLVFDYGHFLMYSKMRSQGKALSDDILIELDAWLVLLLAPQHDPLSSEEEKIASQCFIDRRPIASYFDSYEEFLDYLHPINN
jgi:hypothetical protein